MADLRTNTHSLSPIFLELAISKCTTDSELPVYSSTEYKTSCALDASRFDWICWLLYRGKRHGAAPPTQDRTRISDICNPEFLRGVVDKAHDGARPASTMLRAKLSVYLKKTPLEDLLHGRSRLRIYDFLLYDSMQRLLEVKGNTSASMAIVDARKAPRPRFVMAIEHEPKAERRCILHVLSAAFHAVFASLDAHFGVRGLKQVRICLLLLLILGWQVFRIRRSGSNEAGSTRERLALCLRRLAIKLRILLAFRKPATCSFRRPTPAAKDAIV
mmetsp:Transcript_6914/g.8435  ORF Transcript_6914/g.8435 Transcript_6914/m.8435 type:complete len:273 (-) Transcript_6914:279-1097(-)